MLYILNTKDPQIIQQNKVLMGGQTINLRARQLVYALAALMDRDNPTAAIEVDANQFLNFINEFSPNKWSDIYQLTKDIGEHLRDNPILIKKKRGKDFLEVNWLSSIGVQNGKLVGRFSGDIADYFIYKQGLPYTKLLWDLRGYKSSYTARIMDLFQNNHIKESGKKEVVFEETLDELKLFFGVHQKYKVFKDFDRRVLQVSQKELEDNDQVPYWFEYEKIREGRSIRKIRFTVHVRPKVLLELIPKLNRFNKSQLSIFENSDNIELSKSGKAILHDLVELKIREEKALKIMYNLSYTQCLGYVSLVKYGVNRDLAFTLVKDHCSFSHLKNYENRYVDFCLKKIEDARIKRIMENKKSASKKKTTPEDKRGGLVKKPLQDQVYFGEFMDIFSSIRNEWDEEPEPLFIEKV